MVTIIFRFPHHVSCQTELRSVHVRTGSPVTATVASQHHASHQAELRSVCANAGSPMTATVAFSQHASRQAEVRSVRVHEGNPVTATLVFSPPLQPTELRWVQAYSGSPVTATVAFPQHASRQAELCSIRTHAGSPRTATVAFPRLPTQTATLKWETDWKTYTTATVRFRNDYHNIETASIRYRYDWKTICGTSLRYRHWSVVPPGWRIVAKNIETGESFDLGFIAADAEDKCLYVLDDRSADYYSRRPTGAGFDEAEGPSRTGDDCGQAARLLDGDYEISVLTSSLFWKDCLDRTVRTISVRPGEEVTSLPTIYNLRSAVLEGMTTIRWSANRSELDDCVFGIWYSSESPVDTDRSPDATIWYYSSQTEYATTFRQNAPAYVAVAAMRTGEPEIGKIHELYLDWSNVPPHAPDDVVVLDAPLSAFDQEIEKRDGSFWTLWNG